MAVLKVLIQHIDWTPNNRRNHNIGIIRSKVAVYRITYVNKEYVNTPNTKATMRGTFLGEFVTYSRDLRNCRQFDGSRISDTRNTRGETGWRIKTKRLTSSNSKVESSRSPRQPLKDQSSGTGRQPNRQCRP